MLYERIFPALKGDRWTEINIDEIARQLMEGKNVTGNPALDPYWCMKQQEELFDLLQCDYAWGGYMEDRSFVWRGHYHQNGFIHYGVDYYVPASTPVFLPGKGKLLCLEEDPDPKGGWGSRAVYQMGNQFVIFAHLYSLMGEVGRGYSAGDLIGLVASPNRNGGWAPHLHVQCMKNYNLSTDGYGPLLDTNKENFPNPEEVL